MTHTPNALKAPHPLNIIHVIADQHMAMCMGHEGHPQALTPHLDKLAAQGVRFTSAYAANPICTPSRVSILSGQYTHNHGYFGLAGPQPGQHHTRPLPNLFGHFKHAGYRTAGIGKLHMPNDPRNWIADDVDLFADCYTCPDGTGDSRYVKYLRELGLLEKEDSVRLPEFPGRQQHEGRPSLLPYEHNVESWCVHQATAFMDESQTKDQPFFMQVSFPRPHQCYTPDQRFWEMYAEDLDLPETFNDDVSHRPPHFQKMVQRYRATPETKGLLEPKGLEAVSRRVWRAYLACITQCDDALGRLMKHLDDTGLAKNTVVVYLADHGAYSTTYGVPEKAPGICSEKVCRIPMIWRVPGVTDQLEQPQQRVCEQLVHQVDLAPTFCALTGVEAMTSGDGVDLSPLLRGEGTPVRDVAVTEHVWSKSIRYKQWRLVHYQPEMFGVGTEKTDTGELYDLASDPDERCNLYHDAASQPIVHTCRRLLLEWLIGTNRPVTCLPGVNEKNVLAGDGREIRAILINNLHTHMTPDNSGIRLS